MSYRLSSGTYRRRPVFIRQKCRATINGLWKSIKDTSRYMVRQEPLLWTRDRWVSKLESCNRIGFETKIEEEL